MHHGKVMGEAKERKYDIINKAPWWTTCKCYLSIAFICRPIMCKLQMVIYHFARLKVAISHPSVVVEVNTKCASHYNKLTPTPRTWCLRYNSAESKWSYMYMHVFCLAVLANRPSLDNCCDKIESQTWSFFC